MNAFDVSEVTVDMDKQSIKQRARRTALDAQAKRRARHAEREKRLERLAVQVLVAVRERDEQVSLIERRAGDALAQMSSEGLAVRDLVEWCGDELSAREVSRLRRLAKSHPRDPDERQVADRAETDESPAGRSVTRAG
ncbi:hypothetical protein [Segeticoccus rhizosphaerae]|uniref:hypothetical protein n=1 Tax=Segeticoccus rhizosphaerae TaxID=1104777 RepID=UPI0010BF8E7C|nr:hypothetical protein [Ornithinicoccus soli]